MIILIPFFGVVCLLLGVLIGCAATHNAETRKRYEAAAAARKNFEVEQEFRGLDRYRDGFMDGISMTRQAFERELFAAKRRRPTAIRDGAYETIADAEARVFHPNFKI